MNVLITQEVTLKSWQYRLLFLAVPAYPVSIVGCTLYVGFQLPDHGGLDPYQQPVTYQYVHSQVFSVSAHTSRSVISTMYVQV